jgi:hypothetical protein
MRADRSNVTRTSAQMIFFARSVAVGAVVLASTSCGRAATPDLHDFLGPLPGTVNIYSQQEGKQASRVYVEGHAREGNDVLVVHRERRAATDHADEHRVRGAAEKYRIVVGANKLTQQANGLDDEILLQGPPFGKDSHWIQPAGRSTGSSSVKDVVCSTSELQRQSILGTDRNTLETRCVADYGDNLTTTVTTRLAEKIGVVARTVSYTVPNDSPPDPIRTQLIAVDSAR